MVYDVTLPSVKAYKAMHFKNRKKQVSQVRRRNLSVRLGHLNRQDFCGTVGTPADIELNVWYHTLNCGYRCRISGETDFPCLYDERIGVGRVYVKSTKEEALEYDDWLDGRSDCCDGLSHLIDFQIKGMGVGQRSGDGHTSLLTLPESKTLEIKVRAAAILEYQPRDDIRSRSRWECPYWHLERARIGDS